MHNPKTLPAFDEVMAYLDAFTNYERVTDYQAGPATLGTERIEEALKRLGDPQTACPAVHIAGSKGKGSTAYLSASLLQALGHKVGLFTSPHVNHIRERIQINGEPIREAFFCECFAEVQPVVEAMRQHPVLKPPTYFEILTAMGFVAFARAGVERMVVEVGLGGRLDATNVRNLPARASAITTISRDHVKQLGHDLVSIAGEKAGILRPGTPVVLSPQEAGVDASLRERARALDCPVRSVGEDVRVTLREPPPVDAPEAPQRVDIETWRACHRDVPLPLLGTHQRDNAAAAMGLVESLLEAEGAGPVDTAAIRRAWREAHLPGRIEVVARRPWILLDGAHNPASAWALAETIESRFAATDRALVFSAARHKEIPTMLRVLAPLAKCIVLTTIPSPRSLDLEETGDHIADNYDAELLVEPTPLTAVDKARSRVGSDGLVCVTGSLYLVGAVRQAFVASD